MGQTGGVNCSRWFLDYERLGLQSELPRDVLDRRWDYVSTELVLADICYHGWAILRSMYGTRHGASAAG
jgi:hypothetical protein